jgi:hypothetical protein
MKTTFSGCRGDCHQGRKPCPYQVRCKLRYPEQPSTFYLIASVVIWFALVAFFCVLWSGAGHFLG